MERVNVYQFYTLGHTLHALSGMKATDKLQAHYYALLSARKWLEYVLKDNLVALSASRPACLSLLGAVKTLLEPTVPEGAPEGTAPSLNMDKEVGPFGAFSITSGLQTLEGALAAELQSVDTYRVSRKLAYETRLLIEEGDKLLPDNIRAQVPATTVQELKQAGKCIASDIPTAACFHIIRATEAVIRKYYAVVVKRSVKPKMRNWGAYVRILKAAGADRKVTGFLDHIRKNYRNPVLHPEESLSPEDAQALLGVCISAIVTMVQAMQAAPAVQPAAKAAPLAAPAKPARARAASAGSR